MKLEVGVLRSNDRYSNKRVQNSIDAKWYFVEGSKNQTMVFHRYYVTWFLPCKAKKISLNMSNQHCFNVS